MLATALKLEANTASEENFLQVHGGLHFGKVLKRAGNYFGSALNLVSRIAAKSVAGTFCCSEEFVTSLADKSVCTFKSKGYHHFKNITEEKEIFELGIEKTKTSYIDPVCRMLILNPQNATHHPGKNEIYFCSSACLELYRKPADLFQCIQKIEDNECCYYRNFLRTLNHFTIVFLKQLDKKVIYGLILSGIGFLYVGFVWADLQAFSNKRNPGCHLPFFGVLWNQKENYMSWLQAISCMDAGIFFTTSLRCRD